MANQKLRTPEVGALDLEIKQGETFNPFLRRQDGAGGYFNFTGYTARAHVRQKIGDAATLIELTTVNGGLTLTTDGYINFLLSAADTAALTFVNGVWDFELIDASSKVQRLFAGKVKVLKEVTR